MFGQLFSLMLLLPIVQIILIYLRIKKELDFPIGTITGLIMMAGIVYTLSTSGTVDTSLYPEGGPHCLMAITAYTMGGLFISIVISSVTGVIGCLVWHSKQEKSVK